MHAVGFTFMCYYMYVLISHLLISIAYIVLFNYHHTRRSTFISHRSGEGLQVHYQMAGQGTMETI